LFFFFLVVLASRFLRRRYGHRAGIAWNVKRATLATARKKKHKCECGSQERQALHSINLFIIVYSKRSIIEGRAANGASFCVSLRDLSIRIAKRNAFLAHEPVGLGGRKNTVVKFDVVRLELKTLEDIGHDIDTVDGEVD
jgi:hypothetical protein